MNEETEARGRIATALAKAQSAYPPIPRSRTVTVRSDKGDYTFDYAPLDAILAAVKEPLASNGLALTQLLLGDEMVTLLIHESGACLESRLALPLRKERIQQFGAEITYLRRYSLQAMLGIAAEDDNDASPTNGRPRQRRPASTRGVETSQTTQQPATTPAAPAQANGNGTASARAAQPKDPPAPRPRAQVKTPLWRRQGAVRVAKGCGYYRKPGQKGGEVADVERMEADAYALGHKVIGEATLPAVVDALIKYGNKQADLAAQREEQKPAGAPA